MLILKHVFGMLAHPVSTLNMIKENRNNFSYAKIIIIYLLLFLVKISNVYITHFPLRKRDIAKTNLLNELIVFAFILFIFILVDFAVTAINDGETTMKEILYTIPLCFMPYILFSFISAVVSNIMCIDEAMVYNIINFIIFAWVGILIFLNIIVLNNYTFIKTIGVIILILFCMTVLTAFLITLFIIAINGWWFIENMIIEARYRF